MQDSRLHDHAFQKNAAKDMAEGFASFVDKFLRGRENKYLFNSSIGLSALEIGLPSPDDLYEYEPFMAVVNNTSGLNKNAAIDLGVPYESPHEFMNLSEGIFMGFDFPDFFGQFAGNASEHGAPIYENTVGNSLGLPDLPYGGMAHLAHMAMALYDTGRTFKDLWDDPALHHNVTKILTHPEMGHTVAHKGVMLSVMGLLHPLGPIVAIGCAYLCGHLVHSFFNLLDHNKSAFQKMQDVPVLREVYNATGIKEWAEAEETHAEVPADEDPFDEEKPVATSGKRTSREKPDTTVSGERSHNDTVLGTELSIIAGY